MLLPCACSYDYGDWVPPPPFGQTDKQLIAAFPFLKDVTTLMKMATVLNDQDTLKDYTALYANLTATFHSLWYKNATIGYADGMQAANILALALPGVVPDNLKAGVLKALVSDLQMRGHLTTGIVSTANLFPVLSANKQHDLALQLAQSTVYPSYGWMFTNPLENATTLWELWDSPVDSVDGPDMDSRNQSAALLRKPILHSSLEHMDHLLTHSFSPLAVFSHCSVLCLELLAPGSTGMWRASTSTVWSTRTSVLAWPSTPPSCPTCTPRW